MLHSVSDRGADGGADATVYTVAFTERFITVRASFQQELLSRDPQRVRHAELRRPVVAVVLVQRRVQQARIDRTAVACTGTAVTSAPAKRSLYIL